MWKKSQPSITNSTSSSVSKVPSKPVIIEKRNVLEDASNLEIIDGFDNLDEINDMEETEESEKSPASVPIFQSIFPNSNKASKFMM